MLILSIPSVLPLLCQVIQSLTPLLVMCLGGAAPKNLWKVWKGWSPEVLKNLYDVVKQEDRSSTPLKVSLCLTPVYSLSIFYIQLNEYLT